jgi:hypothetical protein
MFLATSRHPNWDICHIGAQVSLSPRRRSLPPTFWPNAARLRHLITAAESCRQKSLSGEKGESSVLSNLLIHLVKQIGSGGHFDHHRGHSSFLY